MKFNEIKKYDTVLFMEDCDPFDAGETYPVHEVGDNWRGEFCITLAYECPYGESDYSAESISEDSFIEAGCRVVNEHSQERDDTIAEFDKLVQEVHEAAKKANSLGGVNFPDVIVLADFQDEATWYSSRC